jgi:hypothetical protein
VSPASLNLHQQAAEAWVNPFADLQAGDWFYEQNGSPHVSEESHHAAIIIFMRQ